MYEFDFTLTVSPFFYGEYQDALGMQRALEELGYVVYLNALSPVHNIRREVNLPFSTHININFHSGYRPSRQAEYNFLFYHELHDKHSFSDVPMGIFREYDGVFTVGSEFAKKIGVNHFVLAADPDKFYPVQPIPQFKCDVVFIGSMHQFRDVATAKEYILPLQEAGYTVHLYGAGWDKEIYGESVKGILPNADVRKVYSSAKVGLNFVNETYQAWGSATNRLFQMGACGIPAISYTCKDHYDAYGEDEKIVLWADHPEQVLEKVTYLMEHKKVRETMSKRIRKRTLDSHTWTTRIQSFLELVQKPEQAHRDKQIVESQVSSDWDMQIAIPSKIDTKFTLGVSAMMLCTQPLVRAKMILPRWSFDLAKVRCEIFEEARKERTPWVLMIDDDTIPDKNHLNYLIEDISKGHKIITGWYKGYDLHRKKFEPYLFVDGGFGMDVKLTDPIEDGLVNVTRAPAGYLCVSLEVIDALFERNITPFLFPGNLPKEVLEYLPEDHPIKNELSVLGEDTYFMAQARRLGYQTVLDTRLFCEHIKTTIVGKDGEFTT